MADEKKIRAFIALKTPPEWDERLRTLQNELGDALRGAGKFRWIKPEQLHLTLRFLGHIPPAEVEQVKRAAADIGNHVPTFQLRYNGLGCFPRPSAPRVLWAGLEMEETLRELHERINAATANLGQPIEKRDFQPHLTLARIENFERGKANLLEDLFAKHTVIITEPWTVTELLLMRSHLSPQGSRYEPLLVQFLRKN